MPRKFTRIVLKCYSMKKTDGQATASNQEAVEMVDVGTQTETDENVKPADAGTQADLLQPSMTETGV